jgi:sterol desaturase/sphingolipid hydroxylase (fatty acid hydroxylase superfamily)
MAEIDVQVRDKRGEWQPADLPAASPLFSWPLRLVPLLKALRGLVWPHNALFASLAIVSWLFFTPALSRTATFAFGWVAEIYLRNAVLIILVYGALHLRLYMQRSQGDRFKFSDRWPSADNRLFLFRNQNRDNVFWTLASGCTIWSGYEALTLWAYANDLLPMITFAASPVYFVLLMVAVGLMRSFHFYWAHRITHWKPLYKSAHYLHHKNINPGPWSGMAMHPIEHLIYLSGVLVHWIIPSHPLHAIYHLLHAGLSPATGHAGFDRLALNGEDSIKNGGYFHYLHHRFFDCNYGADNIPLDRWFGSFHDGTPDSEVAMRARRKRLKGVQA